MRVVALPPLAELEKVLAGLLQRAVKVAAVEDTPEATAPVALALYRTDAPVLEVAAVCDLPLAAALGAALTLVPAGAAKDAAASGAVDESIRENLAEVMNVVARFVSGSGRRFALVRAWCPPDAAPAELVAAARASDETRGAAVEVPGYVSGRLAFHTL